MSWRRFDAEAHRRESPWPIGTVGYTDDGEISTDPSGLMLGRQPTTELEALMQTAPHTEPAASIEATAALRDVLGAAIDELEPRARYVFEAHALEGVSFRQLEKRMSLSKTHLHRLYGQAVAALAEQLEDHPLIAERLRSTTTSEEA